ncbi:MAG: TIGR00296 family protein [Candidatus Nezhaarchaeales archaeon]
MSSTPSILDEDGAFLVRLARRAVREYFSSRRVMSPPQDTPTRLYEKRGVFVTIESYPNRELRGCIGFPEPIYPLVEATIRASLSSAFEDPRFPPLTESELKDVVFEVSVLTPPQLVKVSKPTEYPSKIKVGVDGLIVEKGFFKGLLLPQVAVEYGWNEEEFLTHCCLKALLPPDAWLDPRTKIYKFQAEIFEEEAPEGPIRRKKLS